MPAVKPPIGLAARPSLVRQHWSPRVVAELNDYQFKIVKLGPGELYVVPRGVEHITRADGECQALIIEPRGW